LNPVPIKNLGVACLTGSDTGAFLQSQLSADIAVLQPGDATFACYCTPRGQVLGLLLVCRTEADYRLIAAMDLLEPIVTRLRMFVMRSKVELAIEADLTVCGVTASTAVPGAFRPTGTNLHYLLLEKQDVVNDGPALFFKAEEICNRVVWLGPETSEKFIPQMLGFEELGAVSFSKGCYPGQEIVARARYLGKVKRKPVVVRSESELLPEPATRVALRRGNEWLKGTVVDSAPAENGGSCLFIIAPGEPEGETVEIEVDEKRYRCATI